MKSSTVVSRHRLPRFYRVSLAALWLTPIGLFIAAILLSRGFTLALFDPRFVLPCLLLTIPARYVWQEGIDVLHDGIIARTYWPRYYAFDCLDEWYLDVRPNRRVLTIWNQRRAKVFESRMGHLTDLPLLLKALKEHVRYRGWPETSR